MKTILQISRELGVSKQAVYKRFKGKLYTDVLPYVHTNSGTTYIAEQGENIIKQDFLQSETASAGVYTEHIPGIDGAHTERVPDTGMETLIQMLQKELEIKNRQIEELTATIRIQAESINADRRNELAGTIIGGTKLIEDAKPPQPKKRGFFRWLFDNDENK